MPLLNWKSDYSVNHAELDQHHQQFISILNGLYGSCFDAERVDDVNQNIEELLRTVKCHFSAEEDFMRKNGYPGLESHIREHHIFNEKILELQHTFHNNHLELTKELIIYLGKWLLRHLLKEDRQYAQAEREPMTQ